MSRFSGFVYLLTLLVTAGPVLAQNNFVLNTGGGAPLTNKDQTGFLDIIVSKAFASIGKKVITVQLPSERALINANEGIDDGELFRIGGLEKLYPNLIQVPEFIWKLELMAFTKNTELPVKGWDSLKPYSVNIVRGWKIVEQKTAGVANLTKVQKVEQLFYLLSKDRVDISVYSRWLGLYYLMENRLEGISILEPPLEIREEFIYLHKKHEKIVPRLARALRKLKADGTYQKTYRKIFSPLFPTLKNDEG